VIEPNLTRVTKLERRAWSIAEVSERLGVSRNFLLGHIRGGLLRARRLGRRVVILSEDLDTYLNNAEEVCTDPHNVESHQAAHRHVE
jgi:excisionase family DNA binding protein